MLGIKMTSENSTIFSELTLSKSLSDCEDGITYRAQFYNEEDQYYGDEISVEVSFPDNETTVCLMTITQPELDI